MSVPLKRLFMAAPLAGFALLMGVLSACDSGNDSIVTTPPSDTVVAFDINNYSSAEDCRGCHPDQVEQWEGSMHAYAAKDPVMTAINFAGQMAYVNAIDQGCVKCHAFLSSRAGETPWGAYDVETISPQGQEGITCDVCHMVESIGAIQNGEINLTTERVRHGTIRDPEPNAFHESKYQSLLERSEFCGVCHDIDNGHGLLFEATFKEWRDGGFAETGKTCGDCHMQEYTGRATPTSPVRTLHDHSMPGTDLAFIDNFPGKTEQLQMVTDLLENSLSATLTAPGTATVDQLYSFSATFTNDKTGHNVPSGATFLREVWAAVTVIDAAGDTLYSSGMLDANDDIMDDDSEFPERDADLFNLQSTMLRADSSKTWAPWEIAYLVDPTLKAGDSREADYSFTVPGTAVSPFTVDIALRYRTFPPHILREFELDWMLPLPIINMVEMSQVVTIQ